MGMVNWNGFRFASEWITETNEEIAVAIWGRCPWR